MLINTKLPKDNERERSWFMVLNNPEEHIPDCENMTPEEIVDYLADKWMVKNGDNASRVILSSRLSNMQKVIVN